MKSEKQGSTKSEKSHLDFRALLNLRFALMPFALALAAMVMIGA